MKAIATMKMKMKTKKNGGVHSVARQKKQKNQRKKKKTTSCGKPKAYL